MLHKVLLGPEQRQNIQAIRMSTKNVQNRETVRFTSRTILSCDVAHQRKNPHGKLPAVLPALKERDIPRRVDIILEHGEGTPRFGEDGIELVISAVMALMPGCIVRLYHMIHKKDGLKITGGP